MTITLNVRNFLLIIFCFFLIVNTSLFILRELFPLFWWSGEYQFYVDVNSGLHMKAFVSFIFYFLVFFSIAYFLLSSKKEKFLKKKDMPFIFIAVSCYLALYSWASYAHNVGVAASTDNTAGTWAFLFYFISADALYVAYSLIEKSKKRFFIVSLLFSLSNVFRGWASFPIIIILVVVLRNRYKVNVFLMSFLSFLSLPFIGFLLYLRDIFRGGTGFLIGLDLKNDAGYGLVQELILKVVQKIIVRYDFYSHYIGISSMHDFKGMCFPFEENIFTKILYRSGLASDCVSLGSMLPSHLASWYLGRGTAFTVSSGFFSLPTGLALTYFTYNIIFLFFFLILVKLILKQDEAKKIVLFYLFFMLLPGWNYQFIFFMITFLICFALFSIKSSQGYK